MLNYFSEYAPCLPEQIGELTACNASQAQNCPFTASGAVTLLFDCLFLLE
jgi:hypothetical protein